MKKKRVKINLIINKKYKYFRISTNEMIGGLKDL